MTGTIKNQGSHLITINGTANHVHILMSQSKNVALSYLMAELKKSSSKWIKTRDSTLGNFSWQDGYGAFSIGESNVPALKQYIAGQKEKHRIKSFEDELIEFLKAYGVEYDEHHLWD